MQLDIDHMKYSLKKAPLRITLFANPQDSFLTRTFINFVLGLMLFGGVNNIPSKETNMDDLATFLPLERK